MDKSNVISIDHDIIQFNHSESYTKSVNVKIIAGGLVSNEYNLLFRPLPLKINSVPLNKKGYITIIGERLSNIQLNSKSILVKIGNSICTNVISTQNQITCEIQPFNNSTSSKDLPVIISIDSIENDNKLLFSYGIPFISNDYTLPQGILHLNGDCLGSNSTTLIFIDGKQQNNLTINIDENEKTLSFQLPSSSLKVSVSITVNGISSNVLSVDASFYATVSESSPSVNGQLVEYTLTNINQPNYNLIPTITILPENNVIKGNKVNTLKSIDQSIQTYSFLIPKGCGKKRILISIGNQTSPSEFNYEVPHITNCLLGDKETIFCNGTFNDFISYFKSDQLNIKFSDQIITNNEINWNNNSLSFLSKPSYASSELYVQLCDFQSSALTVNITPFFDKTSFDLNPKFNSNGGTIGIIGKNFNEKLAQDTLFECLVNKATTTTRFNCTYQSYSSILCDIPLKGPDDQSCNFIFDGIKQFSTSQFTISYNPPLVLNSTNQIDPAIGGIITITGQEFYETIDNVTIDGQVCKNVICNSTTKLQCYLDPLTIKGSKDFQFVNVTINGKSNGTYLKIYSSSNIVPNEKKDIETKDDSPTKKKKDYKILLVLLAIPFIVAFSYFIVYKKIKKRIKEKKERDIILKRMDIIDNSYVPSPPPLSSTWKNGK